MAFLPPLWIGARPWLQRSNQYQT